MEHLIEHLIHPEILRRSYLNEEKRVREYMLRELSGKLLNDTVLDRPYTVVLSCYEDSMDMNNMCYLHDAGIMARAQARGEVPRSIGDFALTLRYTLKIE